MDRSGVCVVLVSGQPVSLFHAGVVSGAAGAQVDDGSAGEHFVVDVGRKLVLGGKV